MQPPEFTDESNDLPLWKAWIKGHHGNCGGWMSENGILTCACGAGIPLAAEVAP